MHLVRTFAAVLLVATSLPACHLSLAGNSVSDHGGVLYMDDVAMEFQRDVELSMPFEDTELRLATATGEIDVTASTDGQVALTLVLHSEFEDDGQVSLMGGSLKVRSELGGKVLINSIRGTIPAGCSLHVQSGTGRIVVRDMTGGGSLDADSATGGVFVTGGKFSDVRVDTGTGDMHFDNLEAENLRIRSGTGRAAIAHSRLGSVRANTGTGDLSFSACEVEDANLDSGTGDVRLVDTQVGRLSTSLGTGEVSMERTGSS